MESKDTLNLDRTHVSYFQCIPSFRRGSPRATRMHFFLQIGRIDITCCWNETTLLNDRNMKQCMIVTFERKCRHTAIIPIWFLFLVSSLPTQSLAWTEKVGQVKIIMHYFLISSIIVDQNPQKAGPGIAWLESDAAFCEFGPMIMVEIKK